jgi:hypothetical protein
LTQSDPFAVTVYTLKLTHPASPPPVLQASESPVAGKRARSDNPSLVGGRRAKPAGAGPVAMLPPARTSNRLRPSCASGSPRPPLVRIAPVTRTPDLQYRRGDHLQVTASLSYGSHWQCILQGSSRFALLVVNSSSLLRLGSEYRIKALQWTFTVTMTGRLRARPKAGPAVRLPLAVSFGTVDRVQYDTVHTQSLFFK